VGRIEDRVITSEELDKRALSLDAGMFSGATLRQATFEARRRMLDEMIAEELFSREAKARGTTPDALVQQEVMSQVMPVSDADVVAWYRANQDRVQGAPIEQVGEQIRQFLQQQQVSRASAALIERLKAKTKVVEVTLDPPRLVVAIPADARTMGPPEAPVQFVAFSDFQCQFCAKAAPLMKQIVGRYGDKVRIVFRDFPLPIHPLATKAAEAARCANVQGKFWDYHDRLFANQQALSEGDLKRHARDLGLDAVAFATCLDTGTFAAAVQADLTEGRSYGIGSTPTFFINGRLISGALPLEAFSQVIDEELARPR
jgi:protein-disulfide isomerase